MKATPEGVTTGTPFPPDTDNWFQVASSENPATGTGIFRMTQGAGASQRIGRKVVLKSIFFRMHMRNAVQQAKISVRQNPGIRLMLLLDTQSNGALPVTTDVFDEAPAADETDLTGGVLPSQYLMRIENSQRFKVLMDKTYYIRDSTTVTIPYATVSSDNAILDQPTSTLAGLGCKDISVYKKLNIPIEFGGSTNDVNIVKSNAIYLCFNVIGAYSYISFNGRTRFLDV